jgi:sulfotransferase famil protein
MHMSEADGRNLFVHDGDPKFVYIANLKAGYTSILAGLTETFPDLKAYYWERETDVEGLVRDHLIFSFVRHPVSRVTSFYVDKLLLSPRHALASAEPPPPQECQSVVFNACAKFWDTSPLPETVSDRLVYERLERLNISDFIYLLPVIARSDRHLYPQSAWLEKFPSLKPHCQIGRIEDFAADWQTICEKLSAEITLRRRNESDYRTPGARFHLNPAWRRVIDEVYEQDLHEFYADRPLPAGTGA